MLPGGESSRQKSGDPPKGKARWEGPEWDQWRDDERFTRVGESSREEGHTLGTPLLPGLSIALEDLFR